MSEYNENKEGTISSYFVDTADSETESATLDTRAIHVVTNQEDKLRKGRTSEHNFHDTPEKGLTLSNSLKFEAPSNAFPASESFRAPYIVVLESRG